MRYTRRLGDIGDAGYVLISLKQIIIRKPPKVDRLKQLQPGRARGNASAHVALASWIRAKPVSPQPPMHLPSFKRVAKMANRFSWPLAVFGGLLGLAAWQGQRLSVSDALWPVEAQPAHLSLAGEAEKAKVLIISTGGTFGMKPLQPSTGQRGMQLAPAPGFLENFLQGMQELQDPTMPQYEVRELEPLIDSSAMGPQTGQRLPGHLSGTT